MLIQLLMEAAVGCFVTLPFGFGTAVTCAILLGTLCSLLALCLLSESLEIDDVAHHVLWIASAPTLPPECRLKSSR